MQIAAVAAWEAKTSAADWDSANAIACAAAAQQILLQLLTETSHGIAPSAVSTPLRNDMSGECEAPVSAVLLPLRLPCC